MSFIEAYCFKKTNIAQQGEKRPTEKVKLIFDEKETKSFKLNYLYGSRNEPLWLKLNSSCN